MSYAPFPAIIGRSFTYVGMLVLLSTHFALNFAKTGVYFLSLDKFTSGQAALPYQYRVLTAPILKALVGFFTSIDLKHILHNCPEYITAPEQQAYFVVNVISLIIAFGAFLLIAKEVFTSRAEIFGAASLFVITVYFTFIINPSHQFILPYDLPSLAFTQVCCFLVLRRRWIILLVVFALAAVNRETILLIIFFVATRVLTGSETRRTGIAVVATLSFIWLAVKSLLFLHFAGAASDDAALGGIRSSQAISQFGDGDQAVAMADNIASCRAAVLTVRFLFEKPSKEALEWIAPYLLGFTILLFVAVIIEN